MDALNAAENGVTVDAHPAHLTPQAALPQAVTCPVAPPLPTVRIPLRAEFQSTGTTLGTDTPGTTTAYVHMLELLGVWK